MRVRVVVDDDPPRDLVVDVADPAVTVGDLLRRLDASPEDPTRAFIDGRPVDVDQSLVDSGIADGSTIGTTPSSHGPLVHATDATPCTPDGHGAVWVTVVAGPDSGRSTMTDTDAVVVGRGRGSDLAVDDPSVSRRHVRIEPVDGGVTVTDLGSHNGTWIDGRALLVGTASSHDLPITIRTGTSVLQVCDAVGCDVLRGHDPMPVAGRRLVHRPPRPPPPTDVDPVVAPRPPDERGSTPALRWAALLAPLALGGAMVAMTGSLRFALFALLSPVMLVANWWSARRDHRRRERSAAATREAEAARFQRDLAAAGRRERARREALAPHLAEVARRATEPSRRLWERRSWHGDAHVLRWGSAEVSWRPPISGDDPGGRLPTPAPGARPTYPDDQPTTLGDLPILLDLRATPVVGLAGPRSSTLAVARSLLLQSCTLHGPADLVVAVPRAPAAASEWGWAKWLPHLAAPDRGRPTDTRGPSDIPARLVVVDPAVTTRRHGRGRRPRADRSTGGADGPRGGTDMALVLVDHPDQLPADCTAIMWAREDGSATITTGHGDRHHDVLVSMATAALARRVARALARCRDPDRAVESAGLAEQVALADLSIEPSGEPLGDAADRLRTPLGLGHDGELMIDLVADGPHALVAGTTGSGKSELLRSLVVGLACRHTAEQVVFVLIDYKGGSAFRACVDLPHTVGLVTDLDDHLGARALTSLRAELRRRERQLADAAVADLAGYHARGCPAGPLPRLVVVIDEFATLMAELPSFVEALVAIAQRGRSLGIHLVLATQRPRGCVDANIRANTNLRVALRVQDAAESVDVIDDPRAVDIARDRPGRGWVRRGHEDLERFQAALSSAAPTRAADLEVTSFRLVEPSATAPGDGADDQLERLVAACRRRCEELGVAAPRRPWLEMLADDIPLGSLLGDQPAGRGDEVVLGVADLPAEQAQRPTSWRPDHGNLGVFGRLGSGTTTALATIVSALVLTTDPGDVHLQVLDGDVGAFKDASELPHVGSVVDAHALDEVDGLLDWLLDEIRDRRANPDRVDTRPRLVVVVDGLGGLLETGDATGSVRMADRLAAVFEDGPAVRVAAAVATDRVAGLPPRLRTAFARRLALRLDDRDRAALGIDRRTRPRQTPGRAIDVDDGVVLQVARPPAWSDLRADAPASAPDRRRPHRILGLPDRVAVHDLAEPHGPAPLWIPVGRTRDARQASLLVHPGDHVVVAGPPRSGRTTTLQVLSSQLRRVLPDAVQVAVCDEARSDLHGWPSLDASGSPRGLADVLATAASDPRAWVVVVDDVGRFVDDPVVGGLVATDVTLVVAGRPADLRGPFGGWLRAVRASRTGILLQPELGVDGDLLGARLPRRLSTPMGPGRGFVVNTGDVTIAQLALPPARPPPGELAP